MSRPGWNGEMPVCNWAQRSSDDRTHHGSMWNNLSRARLVGIWCLSVMTIGAWSVVSGAALTMANGEWLFAACILPPLTMLLVWRHRTPAAIAVIAAALIWAIAMPSVRAQSPSRYRDFELGGSLPSISALTGVAESEAKTIHSRPAVIQELRWQRPYATPSDTVQQIVFSFYNDQLSKMVVDYDRDRTTGMTDADLIEIFTTTYGAPLKPGVRSHAGTASSLELESGTLVARWVDADFSVALYRASYASGLRIIVTSSRLDALSRTAIAQAGRLDEREAPRRERERQKKETDAANVLQEKARVANKAAFRP